MKKFLAMVLATAMCTSVLVGCGGTTEEAAAPAADGAATEEAAPAPAADDGEVYELKLAHIYAVDHAFNIGCEDIAADIAEKTNGKVNITVYPAAQLGEETSEINSIQAGAIDFAVLGAGEVGTRVNDFNVFEAPFLFADCAEAVTAAQDPLFDDIYAQTHDHGFTMMEMLYYGARNLTTNNAVDGPDDTLNLKLRVPDVTIYRYMAEYIFGAAPTPMSLSEVYLALQQGVVDGQENPVPTIYAQKFYEVCSHVNLTKHQISIFPVIMSDATRAKLPAEYVEIIDQAFADGAPKINQMVLDAEESLLDEMEATGTVIHTPERREEFEAAASTLVEKAEADGLWSEGLYNAVKEITK